jgi:hypothetical protein
LVLHNSFSIDINHENTGDKSVQNSHFYSDKAPGIVFLSLPFFTLSVGLLSALDIPLESPRAWRASSWMTTVGSVGLITALGAVAIFALLCNLIGQRYSFFATLAVFLGSSPFPYATMLFSHAAVLGLICIALWAIADSVFFRRLTRNALKHAGSESGCWVRRHILAGFCCGMAISSEYTSAAAAGGVLALAFMTNYKRGLVLTAAAIPALLLIPMNNWLCFGSPLAFGYHHLASSEFQAMNNGLFGITFPPKASAAYLILFSPGRGLFFWSPFLLMLLFGLKTLYRISRPLCIVSCLVVVVQVVCISGYFMPNGGAALGPRHLAPMLPFALIIASLGLERFYLIGVCYGIYSIIMTGAATLIDAMPPDNMVNPLITFYLPALLHGEFKTNLGYLIGLNNWVSLIPVLVVICLSCIWAITRPDQSSRKTFVV